MARVTVVFPPLDVSRDFIDYPYFADLGAVQAAAVLREAGHTITLVDALALPGAALEPLPDGRARLGASAEATAARVPDADLVVVAYTPFHRPPAREAGLGGLLATLRARRPAAPLVLADLYQTGQHVVDAPSAATLAAYPEIDTLLRYEAEAALPGLVERLLAQGRPAAPFAERGPEVEPLDSLPLPAWDLVDTEAYFAFHRSVVVGLGRPSWAFPIDLPSLPLLTSRGCPFRCAHCSSNPGLAPGAPKRQRRYSAEYLDRALAALVARGARRVHLLDELANVNERHFDRLLERLEAHDLSFELPNGVRADYVLDEHLARMRGRLTTLSVSAESGVQRVVDEVVGKELDLGAIRRVAARAQQHGVPLLVHFMIGLPGETKAEINGTLDFAIELREAHGAWPSVQFATPLPGTRLAARAAAHGPSLPVAGDWGPRFQQAPSVGTSDFTLEELRAFKETFDLRLSATEGPKKVILNVTYKCNNHCPFCAVGTRTQVDGDLTRQRELLVKYRRQGVTLLDLDGGEPTLNPNLFALIRFARRAGYERINVTTNGRLCAYEDFARRLVTSGVSTLLFSLHGHTRALHAANVGVPEAFDQTLAGIDHCVRHAPAGVELGANLTVTLSNHRHVAEVARLVHEHGLRWLNVQFLTPFGRATHTVNPDTRGAAEYVMRMIDAWGARVRIQVINVPWCYLPGYEAHTRGDLLKLERHMLFVNNEEVNLFEYLREQREHRAECEGCPRRVFCGGFYRMEDVPEPEWLVAPEDLVRPIAERGLTAHPRAQAPRGGTRTGAEG
ncbi:MAG: radical SAM protein [Polyangiaceae bacterium]|nr:radical SAM protein [Polyangiaceae bacterium]